MASPSPSGAFLGTQGFMDILMLCSRPHASVSPDQGFLVLSVGLYASRIVSLPAMTFPPEPLSLPSHSSLKLCPVTSSLCC